MVETTSKVTGLSKIKPAVEFIGGTSILVVIMGVPATVYHYSSLHIPIALLTYRRMLEAGILPAALLLSLLMYLFWVERKPTEGQTSVILGISDHVAQRSARYHYLELPALPFVAPAVFIIIGGFIAMYLWIFWGIGWIFERPIGWLFPDLDYSDRWTLLIGFGPAAILIIALILRRRLLDRRLAGKAITRQADDVSSLEMSRGHSVPGRARRTKGRSPSSYDLMERFMLPRTLKDSVLGSLAFYPLIPVMLIAVSYLIKSAFWLLDISWPAVFTNEVLLVSNIFMGVAYGHFMSEHSFSHLLDSPNQKTSQGARIGRRSTYAIFVSACIALYCLYIYPMLPRSFGGGRPEIVDIVIEAKVIPEPLKRLFPDSDSGNSYLKEVQLIDKTASEAIICKAHNSDSRCFSIPNQSVVSISWKFRE